MNQVKAYKILENSGFSKENAEGLLEALRNDDQNLATKGDLKDLRNELKGDIKDLEIKLLAQMNNQTWKFLGGMSLLGLIFKLADFLMHVPK